MFDLWNSPWKKLFVVMILLVCATSIWAITYVQVSRSMESPNLDIVSTVDTPNLNVGFEI